MPLRRAHQPEVGRVRSRLQAREYFEWMCRSATNGAAPTVALPGVAALNEGTPHPATSRSGALRRHARA